MVSFDSSHCGACRADANVGVRPRPPLAIIEEPAGHTATWMGGFAIAATVVAWMAYIARTVISKFIDYGLHDSQFIGQTIAYVVVMTFLTFLRSCIFSRVRAPCTGPAGTFGCRGRRSTPS